VGIFPVLEQTRSARTQSPVGSLGAKKVEGARHTKVEVLLSLLDDDARRLEQGQILTPASPQQRGPDEGLDVGL